jgi:hypothetical protein
MEGAVLGYLLGLGTVFALVKRGKEARALVAWTARQAGFISGRVSGAIQDASQLARREYEKARLEQGAPRADAVIPTDEPSTPSARLNGN